MPTTTVKIDRSACPKKTGKHGTAGTFRLGCTCPDAERAYSRQNKARRMGTKLWVPRCGTQRRLQALHALGWSAPALAKLLGYGGPTGIDQLRNGKRTPGTKQGDVVYASTARKVRELYDRLSMTPGPSRRSRLHAQRAGWATPLAWEGIDMDDPAAVPDLGEPTRQAGGFVPVDVDELVELYQAGRTLPELVRATGRKESTLVKYLQDRGVVIRERYRMDGRVAA